MSAHYLSRLNVLPGDREIFGPQIRHGPARGIDNAHIDGHHVRACSKSRLLMHKERDQEDERRAAV
ncbi:MAG: hypothetical protein ACM3NQ_02375 [Bacteroidales bacterium]